MTENDQLAELVRKRGNVKAHLTRFETFMKAYTSDKEPELKLRLGKVTPILDEYNLLQDNIEALDNNQSNDREEFENKYFSIISSANKIIDVPQVNTSDKTNVNTDNIANIPMNLKVKLPKITLPEFDGSYDKWLMFSDAFKSLIQENQQLNPTQKFYYLRSCLKGEAEQVINALEASDSNYTVAWDLLKGRYENKRIIIHTHIKELFDYTTIHHESHVYLRKLVDHFQKHVRALTTLGEPTNSWDTLLIHLMTSKLDTKTKRAWESSIATNTMPTLKKLLDFLVNQCIFLETLDKGKNITKSHLQSHIAINKLECLLCKENHLIFRCQKFLSLNVKERFDTIKRLKLCINCLKHKHYNKDCKASNCKKCNQPHNTLLHFENSRKSDNDNARQNNKVEDAQQSSDQNSIITAHSSTKQSEYILLSTAVILIKDIHNNLVQCRALIDSGSQSNFMTKELVERLKLKQSNISIPVSGINQSLLKISHITHAELFSTNKKYHKKLPFLIMNKITDPLPQQSFDISNLNIPQNITLADPNFNRAHNIDILLGAAIFFDLLSIGQIKLGENKPILQNTKLGWLISGALLDYELNNKIFCNLSINAEISNRLEKFWKIEELSDSEYYSKEELSCESHFQTTFKRDEDGRFTVSLPLKEDHINLGESLENAEKRLISMEKKFVRDSMLHEEYTRFMEEYEELGHMTEISNCQSKTDENANYLPHHCVFKLTSSTTRLRVVFDASCKTTNGIALNDILKTGPVVQDDLFSILLRFRKHNYVLTGDITKMYRQINIVESQRDLQRIVWRSDPNLPLKHFKLNTVTYGTAPASFLSTRCLKQLSIENEEAYPEAAYALKKEFYMDDLLTGANSIENLLRLKQDITNILNSAKFELRKFNSNHASIVKEEKSNEVNLVEAKTLGVVWQANLDRLTFTTNLNIKKVRITKRVILSTVSQIFDPLGLIGPIVIRAKLLLQKLWELKIEWDETVPADIYTTARKLFDELENINEISLPRHVLLFNPVIVQIHGFCDASELAYGASIYIRSQNSNKQVCTRLLTAKSRVAPIKTISIPRLELCAALLLSKLMKEVLKALDLETSDIWYWSDSTIVISWLQISPNNLKTFVANRVSNIQSITDIRRWRHVPSEDNPADIISRGLSVRELSNSTLWYSGPTWLSLSSEQWPVANCKHEIPVPEAKAVNFLSTKVDYPIFERYSNLRTLQRVVAYCLRFIRNCRTKINCQGNLSLEELKSSLICLIKLAQKQIFEKEINALKNKRDIRNSKLKSLAPFLDENDVLRVGGRLRNANIDFSQKHPIILPRHQLTNLIIKQKHLENLHAGVQTLLGIIRQEFWPINAKNTIKKILRQCTVCFRINPTICIPRMGCLPKDRTIPVRPFYTTGLDYAGPFLIKDGKLRNRQYIKAYICVFICFITKAVHIELITDLSTDMFLNCLKRFISRRGLCKTLWSDNATNFKGAYNEILKTMTDIKNSVEVKNYLESKEIVWNFIPARTPHFGGIWEAAIKSTKTYLKKIVGNTRLTYESFYTILTQIEAILNSRPLYPLSNDPNDIQALTPGHFLIGESLTALPQRDVTVTPVNRLNNYHQLQQLYQQFWKRWYSEYLHTMQQRNKWMLDSPGGVQVGDLVLLKEDNLPPLKWIMGRIIEVHPAQDGRIRVVTIKTAQGVVKRGVQKVCCFPKDCD